MHPNFKALNTEPKFLGLPVNIAIFFTIALFLSVFMTILKFSVSKLLFAVIVYPSVYITMRLLYRKHRHPLFVVKTVFQIPERKLEDENFMVL